MGRRERGVHRGSLTEGVLALLENALREYGLDPSKLQLVGSLAKGRRGSRVSDWDFRYPAPKGWSEERLRKVERAIQDVTGVDFYFD